MRSNVSRLFLFKYFYAAVRTMATADDSEQVIKAWLRTQNELKTKMILCDTEEWQKTRAIGNNSQNGTSHPPIAVLSSESHSPQICGNDDAIVNANDCLSRVGGMDISYNKNNGQQACVSFVVLQLPDLKVIYDDTKLVEVNTSYVPGFLAFREVDYFVEAVKKLKQVAPHCFPQVILLDGNGILHPNGFGMASHLGVLINVPCIGVAKNIFLLHDVQRDVHKTLAETLQKVGDNFPILGSEGDILGKALKTCPLAKKPVYVSIGHRCELDTAVWVVTNCSIYRVPEPIRQADIRSREYLRKYNDSIQR